MGSTTSARRTPSVKIARRSAARGRRGCTGSPSCPTTPYSLACQIGQRVGCYYLFKANTYFNRSCGISECMVETIGKPVFHRYSGDLYGSWLMDAYEYTEEEEKTKIWATMSDQNRTLFEFSNKTMYRSNHPTKNYSLPLPFTVRHLGTFRGNSEMSQNLLAGKRSCHLQRELLLLQPSDRVDRPLSAQHEISPKSEDPPQPNRGKPRGRTSNTALQAAAGGLLL